ncbi:1-deoxy-D-xylulose-5-phosphate reductoisomerase [Heliophilum fasciatum]|uniref:1-deoxy-D-xylulose 5-phosphate reductoisomerase n=1 Tax=Heliophilum fasciatum TaxID=35700 RepID=A0A4R2RZJ4_9FIRM|nr:1-deoxy-D-xylulose-5-phosphate reductoisomerase [Heliophilum fasciatum]MCW2277905.1 1-deoxy-D-xylulose-5-phosphate reductoisomerase [Heliophilum fasciatum]TCP64525.1 1-deoxy-D-xylulose 5-phosphate reductoisomerase [Heliophilum fasciatum]
MTRRIAILGSTGSIGRQTLEVVDQSGDALQVVALAAGGNWSLLFEQVKKYRPAVVAMMDPIAAEQLQAALQAASIMVEVHTGQDGLIAVATAPTADMVVTAVSGAIGLMPTMAAINSGKTIALANKETLVAAGQLVMAAAKEKNVAILPVDSEHSAIYQCLQGQDCRDLRLILTASGGPFRDFSLEELVQVSPEQALRHPNWAMGAKITIDSASLMNKALEVIEAHWLFDVSFDAIEVLIHPQSVIHSMIELRDGAVLAQLGIPDMRLPIQYALSYPERWTASWPRLRFSDHPNLTFRAPDHERFPCLALAIEAGRAGGTAPVVMNAANEVAVHAFLAHQIGFMDIPRIVRETIQAHAWQASPNLDGILASDQWARENAAMRVAGGREFSG